jgi:hypothetical protein
VLHGGRRAPEQVAHNLTQDVKSRVPPALAGSIVYGSYVPIMGRGRPKSTNHWGSSPPGASLATAAWSLSQFSCRRRTTGCEHLARRAATVAFSPFPPIHRAHLERVLRVDMTRSPNCQRMAANCAFETWSDVPCRRKAAIADRGLGLLNWAESGPLAKALSPIRFPPRPVRIEKRAVCLPNAVYPSCANAASIF